MKIQHQRNWDYDYFKVIIDGKKYPKERGEWYTPYGKDEDERKSNAIKYAIAESEGKYISRGGNIYNSKKEYELKRRV